MSQPIDEILTGETYTPQQLARRREIISAITTFWETNRCPSCSAAALRQSIDNLHTMPLAKLDTFYQDLFGWPYFQS